MLEFALKFVLFYNKGKERDEAHLARCWSDGYKGFIVLFSLLLFFSFETFHYNIV